MNALTRTSINKMILPRVNNVSRTQTRLQSSAMSEFKKNWLSDPGAYPVIGIVGFACSFCCYTMAKQLATNQDVRRSFKARQNLFRE